MADNPLTEPEQFQAWKEHRLTKAFLRYLTDYQTQVAMAWASGSEMTPQDQARAEMAGDLASLSHSDVRGFYGMDEVSGNE